MEFAIRKATVKDAADVARLFDDYRVGTTRNLITTEHCVFSQKGSGTTRARS